IIWPDQADPTYRLPMILWCQVPIPIVVPGMVVALIAAFARRRARELLLLTHVWALLATAIYYFGDTRLRAPYDGILWMAALGAWTAAVRTLIHRFRDGALTRTNDATIRP